MKTGFNPGLDYGILSGLSLSVSFRDRRRPNSCTLRPSPGQKQRNPRYLAHELPREGLLGCRLNPGSAGPGAAATSATRLRPAGERPGTSSPAIPSGCRGGRAQAAVVSRAPLFEAGNCSRHVRAGNTLLSLLAARSNCSEAFP